MKKEKVYRFKLYQVNGAFQCYLCIIRVPISDIYY